MSSYQVRGFEFVTCFLWLRFVSMAEKKNCAKKTLTKRQRTDPLRDFLFRNRRHPSTAHEPLLCFMALILGPPIIGCTKAYLEFANAGRPHHGYWVVPRIWWAQPFLTTPCAGPEKKHYYRCGAHVAILVNGTYVRAVFSRVEEDMNPTKSRVQLCDGQSRPNLWASAAIGSGNRFNQPHLSLVGAGYVRWSTLPSSTRGIRWLCSRYAGGGEAKPSHPSFSGPGESGAGAAGRGQLQDCLRQVQRQPCKTPPSMHLSHSFTKKMLNIDFI